MTPHDPIQSFRASISPNLLADGDFIDWGAVDAQLAAKAGGIEAVQQLIDRGELDQARLKSFLIGMPSAYPLLLDLVAFNTSGSQVEKWGLPPQIGAGADRAEWVAGQLLHVGLGRILTPGLPVLALLRVSEVYKDGFRRRFRSAGQLEARTRRLVSDALKSANQVLPAPVTINPAALADVGLRRSIPFVLAIGNRPIAGIATVFQNQSGGRQQRDLSVTYPNLQERMNEVGMALILLADGQGLKEASERTLAALFEGVRRPMTLAAAAGGALSDAIVEAATAEAPRTVDRAALERIIQNGLAARLEVRADELPAPVDQARLALATYLDTHRKVALELGSDGQSIGWAHRDWVSRARKLKAGFQTSQALALFAELIGSPSDHIKPFDAATDLIAPAVQPFAQSLHVEAAYGSITDVRAREIAQASMETAPGSPIAVYLAPHRLDAIQVQEHRKRQIFLPTNVIVLSAGHLEDMAERRRPVSRLMDTVLTQSDLTKVSPYILTNATPERMFYGRDQEAATVLQTVTTNSVALLGSRRIGKTSLIRRLQVELEKGRFQIYFGDCQTVRTWADFADLAKRKWGADLPDDFRPSHMADLVEQLGSRGDGQVIIILDEIDQLIDWDAHHSEDSVPEAFFRTCRSLSQEGLAHFVFSGERRIANRLWDPQSPHWNFCREVQIAQLERDDAISLITDPLRAMNIEILDIVEFEKEVWDRTSGHPQIVQYLGDRLIRSLDDRADRRSLSLAPDDVIASTNTFEFAEHYLSTYWGQATVFEKSVSRAVAAGAATTGEIMDRLGEVVQSADTLSGALRMLQLYGIIVERDGQIGMRAAWFNQALANYND